MYLVFEFGPRVREIKFAEGIHGELVYSIVSGGHWSVVFYVLDEEWAERDWLPAGYGQGISCMLIWS